MTSSVDMLAQLLLLFMCSAHAQYNDCTNLHLPPALTTAPSQSTIEEALEETAAVLKRGGVIAIPTDTIYGVATLVSSNGGVERIYNIKGRERGKPLAICVSEVAEVYW